MLGKHRSTGYNHIVMATAKKSPVKKSPARKPAAKRTATKAPAGKSREDALAEKALKLVDEAASALRTGIKSGAESTEKTRLATKRHAHRLLTQAQTSLVDAISETTSSLHKIINKLP